MSANAAAAAPPVERELVVDPVDHHRTEGHADPVLQRDLAEAYEKLAEIEPVDVVFDPVGGQLFADSIGLLRPLGFRFGFGRRARLPLGRDRAGQLEIGRAHV